MTLHGIEQNGADLDVSIQGQEQDAHPRGGNVFTSVVDQRPSSSPLNVVFNNNAGDGIEGWGIGHVTLQNAITPTSELETELNAYIDEPAGDRIRRLCLEEGIASRFYGDAGDTELMGAQRPATLTSLLEECAATDLGILSESRDNVAVWYRTRTSIEGQSAKVDLDYSAGEVLGSPQLDRDDQGFANDITAKNNSGTEARAVLDDGSDLSISQPPVGAGRYATTHNVNADDTRLPDLASAVLTLSAVDEPRVGQLSIGFHQLAILADPALSDDLLALELGDKVDVSNMLPEALGVAGSLSQIVQGMRDLIAPYTHRVDWNTTPAAPWALPLLPAVGGGPAPDPFAFDDGRPGEYGDVSLREKWFWEYDRAYFEPRHSSASAAPTRQVWVSAAGGGNGLSQGSPTTIANYMASTGITPAAGDQVRFIGVGPHDITSGTERSLPATEADPIRFVRDDAGVIPVVQNSASGSSTWPFTDSEYLGFHGLDIDGNYPTHNNIWGLSGGQRFSSDTGLERCHHWDVWHCEIHDQAQNCFTFEGTNGNGAAADNRARFVHLFACDIHDSGQNPANNFSELTYFGSGSETNDHAHDIFLEACDLFDGPSGEAIDLKQENFNTHVVGCLIHNIRTESQGAIAAFFAADLYYRYNVMWDVDQTAGGNEGCGIWCSSIDGDYNIMHNIGATAIISSRLQRGTGGVRMKHFVGWNLEQTDVLGQGTLHFQNTSLFDEGNAPVIDFENATCISDDGDQGSHNAAAADFVGPLTGDAEATVGQPGSGFQLAASSSIPATAGALGQA